MGIVAIVADDIFINDSVSSVETVVTSTSDLHCMINVQASTEVVR